MPPASLRRTVSSPARHSPLPKDSRAARAARRERVVLAEIELWRAVAGQTTPPSSSRRSSASSAGSFGDENWSVAGSSIAEEQDADDMYSVAGSDTLAPLPLQQHQHTQPPAAPTRRRAPRPTRRASSPTPRTLRPLSTRAASFTDTVPELRSLEFELSTLAPAPVRPTPTTSRRRSSRLRL